MPGTRSVPPSSEADRWLSTATIRELFVELTELERVLGGPDDEDAGSRRKRYASRRERAVLAELHRRSRALPEADGPSQRDTASSR